MKINGILLVQPRFPLPGKSMNHKDYFPIGLLKIGSYFLNIEKNSNVMLVYGAEEKEKIVQKIGFPKKIFIASIFTYWAEYCYDALDYYTKLFPESEFIFGGIYASLMKDKIKERCQNNYPRIDFKLRTGLFKEAEEANLEYGPEISLLADHKKIDYLVVHSMRGCPRRCKFCGTYIIEPERLSWNGEIFEKYIRMVKTRYPQIKKLVFYDNNFLDNPYCKEILQVLIKLREEKLIKNCESQSGFDGRFLNKELATLIKKAGFIYPKIAWDTMYNDKPNIKKQIDMLINAGYKGKEISVFMIYNWKIPFKEMIKKIKACCDWKVQITDCRYRPLYLDKLDGYNPHKYYGQENGEYYISPEWTDFEVRIFRKIVRKGNIMTRMNWDNKQYFQWMQKEKISKKSAGSSSKFITEDIKVFKKIHKEKIRDPRLS